MAVMRGRAENDGYNALVLTAGLQWRDVALVRTISRFLRQVRVAYSQDYMWATLRRIPASRRRSCSCSTSASIRGSSVRKESAREADRARRRIETALGAVESLDEDRILRRFVNAVTSALRTNFYQTGDGGQPKATIAIKFDSRKIDGMPLPKPLVEIFVYSPRVEGDHLRFGKVARGGIRWSTGRRTFRTEVLGLVKAQQVKNAVIVPVGAKGGFVPKHLPAGPREACRPRAPAAYTVFITSLLDITDNLGPDGVIHPENVVRHDADDPYLVVRGRQGHGDVLRHGERHLDRPSLLDG
jgi:glutamate dehydrogenase